MRKHDQVNFLPAKLTPRGEGSTEGLSMTSRRFPAPWQVEQMPSGYKVLDASGQALAYIYAGEKEADADIAQALTFDEARRIASNIAMPPRFLELSSKQKKVRHNGLAG